ncbi:MAG: ABC transporter ATP-binding protein [Candidatus Izemoplasmatales bacterium]|nr:ABC transporter ATP-binding protein [Candidatus Izemoplasmatales bacterium]
MTQKLIDIENVSVSYGQIRALTNLNLTIFENDYLGIIGPNGGGKSTLLKAILDLVPLNEGKMTYADTSLKKSNIKIGYVPQITEMNRMFPITVFEVVLSGKLPQKFQPFFRYDSQAIQDTLDTLDKVGIAKLADRQINELSGGEFQKMLIARALSLKPTILFLDEPTAMIDNASQKQVFRLLKKLSTEMTIVLVTHQITTILKQVNRLVYIDKNILADGDPLEVYNYMYRQPIVSSIMNRNTGFSEKEETL